MAVRAQDDAATGRRGHADHLYRVRPDAAHAALVQALKIDPEHADARFQLGNLYRQQRRYGEAIANLATISARRGRSSKAKRARKAA